MKRIFLFSCMVGIVLLAVPIQLQAQTQTQGAYMTSPSELQTQGGRIKFGNLSVIPAVAVQGIYDDNIFLGNGKDYPGDPTKTLVEKKESDWITHVKPGLLLNYVMPERGYINLGYLGDFAFYKNNDNNNWKNNQGIFDVNYQAPGGLIVGINELYVKAEDPYGDANQYNLGRVTKRYYNDLKTKVGYTIMSNFRSFLYFNNYKQKYDDSLFDYSQDYTDNEYGIGAESRFLPKTWGFLRYHYGTRQYNTNAPGQTDAFNADAKWHRVNAGLTWDPGAKISGELNVGYQWRKYDHQFTDAAQSAQRDDKNTWIAATSINFMPTEATLIVLNIVRAVRSTASDTNEQFVDTGIGLTLQQRLLLKLTLRAGVNYSRNEYNVPIGNERTDNNYLANVGLDYHIQDWLTVGIGYNYNRKDSNIDIQEFTDNQYLAQLKVVY
ncbi:MAG: outer membrane beta-barrel protein [Syntrophales bacterium]